MLGLVERAGLLLSSSSADEWDSSRAMEGVSVCLEAVSMSGSTTVIMSSDLWREGVSVCLEAESMSGSTAVMMSRDLWLVWRTRPRSRSRRLSALVVLTRRRRQAARVEGDMLRVEGGGLVGREFRSVSGGKGGLEDSGQWG